MSAFIGKTSGGGVVPIPDPNSGDAGPAGPQNGVSDLPMEGAGIMNPMFGQGLAGTGFGPGETKGSVISSGGRRRMSVTDGPGEGSVDIMKIPGSAVKIPKPGY